MNIDLQICLTVYKKTTQQLRDAVKSLPKFAKVRIDVDGGWECNIKWRKIKSVSPNCQIVIHDKNLKLGKLRNIQLEECTSEWIQFVDGDDTVNKVAWNAYEKYYDNADFLVSPVNFISKGTRYVDLRNIDVAKGNGQSYFVIPSIVFKTNFLKSNNLKFDESGMAYEDVVFSVRLADLENLNIGILNDYYNYELPEPNSGTLSCPTDNSRVIDSTIYVIEELLKLEMRDPVICYTRIVEECLRLLQIPNLDKEIYSKVINYMKPYKYKQFKISCRE